MCPCPSQEESDSGTVATLAAVASGTDPRQTCLPGPPVTRLPLAHTDRRVLAEPYKDNKKPGWGQRIPNHPASILVDYSIDFSTQAPFSNAKSACFRVLSLFPGLC